MSVLYIINQSKYKLKECMSSYKTTSGTEKKKKKEKKKRIYDRR